MKRSHLYGPVPSRRFGLSLGVDLLPGKICSYDCIYCQVGRTRELTTRRQQFFPPEEVLAEVEAALGEGLAPDVITLAGRGEPTLYRPLDRILTGLKRLAPGVPLVLITNGSLLHDPEVAEHALLADVLVPSLDAGDELAFRRIDRPHPAVPFGRMVEGLAAVAERHPGVVRMEVMLCAGYNDDEPALCALAGCLGPMKLDAVEINLPVRPVSCPGVTAPAVERVEEAARLFGPRARVVGSYAGRGTGERPAQPREQQLQELLARRPSTREDLATGLGLPLGEVDRLLEVARAAGLVQVEGDYYLIGNRK